MSIKNLFKSSNIVSSASLNIIGQEVESEDYVVNYKKQERRFFPHIDFSNPKSFAKFGSAKKYYQDSIARIYGEFPYDGSESEKIEFYNSSSYLDLYIFDNEYPRTNGYINLSYGGWGTQSSLSTENWGLSSEIEYIQISGSMNEGPDGGRVGSNVYDTGSNRTYNLKLDGASGNTVEFWLKKSVQSNIGATTHKEVIFDLSNGETPSHAAGSTYGRFLIYCNQQSTPYSDPCFYVTCVSGTVDVCTDYQLGTSGSLSSSAVLNDEWNHFAISTKNSGNDLVLNLYLNGTLNNTRTATGGAISAVTGALRANIGSLLDAPNTTDDSGFGYGKLSGSLDEFRYWKVERTPKDIGRYWFSQVGGGTNTDDANTNLGVYYKFNEGNTLTSSYDSIVLDYSGRISNGKWVGYSANARSTGSAIVESSASLSEFKDPIIYSNNPLVETLLTQKEEAGEYYDDGNASGLFKSMPGWIIEEDEDKSKNNLLKLTQIMASFFDDLALEISELPKLKNDNYLSSSYKPYPFVNRLLENHGFRTYDLFNNAEAINDLASRDEKRQFEQKLYDTKNNIYQNIYNNLSYIYKTKGTEKSFRNLIRCFGIDDELIKLNLYSNNSTYTLKDNFKNTLVKKKHVDFNDPTRFYSSVFQSTGSGGDGTNYISSSFSASIGIVYPEEFSVNCEVFFPKKFKENEKNYFATPFITSSLFGVHTVDPTNPTDLSWDISDESEFQVFSVRDKQESKDCYFILTSSYGGHFQAITSSLYRDVYDNNKWNFCVNVRPILSGSNSSELVSGSTDKQYLIEFRGINSILDTIQNEFYSTQLLSNEHGKSILSGSKRLYVGAHNTNFTGSSVQRTDVKISNARFWFKPTEKEELIQYSRDSQNYGALELYKNNYFLKNTISYNIPQIDTLALNWDFSNITSSNSYGMFEVSDFSSGSSETTSRYGWFSELTNTKHYGIGYGFPVNNLEVVDVEYINSARQNLPESIDSEDMVSVLDKDDEYFTKDSRPVEYFFALEKSMYQTVSEEMMNIFGSMLYFNNLIGDPVERYRPSYKKLEKVRQLFFEKIENTPDVEKYIDFYKWIDSSLSRMIEQLIPASANFSGKIRNMIESHILERNKYWNKYPTLEFKTPSPEAGMVSINKHLYDWEHGHHPIGGSQKENCLYWKERALRTDAELKTGNSNLDFDKSQILSASVQILNRKWTTPLRLTIDRAEFKNSEENKRNPLFTRTTTEFDDVGNNYSWITASSVERKIDCNDFSELKVLEKEKLSFTVKDEKNNDSFKGNLVAPFDIFSSSVTSGYVSEIVKFKNNVEINNLHRDVYGDFTSEPLQGTFTKANVGGLQSRHIALNNGNDNQTNRPELFRLFVEIEKLYIQGPDTSDVNTQNVHYPRARYYRNEVAKRMINVANISSSYGGYNYLHPYEIVQGCGKEFSNKEFVMSGGFADATVSNSYFYGLKDSPKIIRGNEKNIFTVRFSAPGGPETAGDANGGPGLDRLYGEYSIFNNLNYRNMLVREYYNILLSGTCNQFGFDGKLGATVNSLNYEGSASFHKINKNPSNRIYSTLSTDDDGNSYATKNIYDNWLIQRPIPQTDKQYSWVTASLRENAFFPYNYATGSEDYDFLSSSSIGTVFANANRGYGPISSSVGVIHDTPLNLNYHIYENVSSSCSEQILGNVNINWSNINNNAYNKAFIDVFGDSNSKFIYLNTLLNKRNGYYNHNTWKQIRQDEHPLVKFNRKNNVFVVLKQDEMKNVSGSDGFYSIKSIRSGIQNCFSESCITSKHKPLIHVVNAETENDKYEDMILEYSYANTLSSFANAELSNILGSSICKNDMYDNIIASYDDDSSPIKEVKNIYYSEILYPREINMYLNKVRERESFVFDEWRNNRTNRNANSFVNSQNHTVVSSKWPLDGMNNFETSTPSTGGADSAGELLNNYSVFHRTSNSNFSNNLKPGPVYCRPTIEYTSSVSYPNNLTGGYVYAGTTKWECAEQAGINPFEDEYEDFSEEIKRIAKDYTVIPEYRISEHMDFYVKESGGNFLARTNNDFTLTGSNISSSAEDNFYKIYSNSDFLKYFNVVKGDHDTLEEGRITLACKSVIKLLPYEGFYPAQRTLQLANLFSQSYGDYVDSVYTSSLVNHNKDKWRSFIQPFFGPGILYNSIKSGIANSYPIYSDEKPGVMQDFKAGTGSFINAVDESYLQWNTVFTNSFSERVPFEALLEPDTYLSKKTIWDMNPEPSSSLCLTLNDFSTNQGSHWGGIGDDRYKLAMHNFLASTVDFFLANGKMPLFSSKIIPNSGINITPEQAKNYFGMDIVMSNSKLKSVSDFYQRKNLSEFSASSDPWNGIISYSDFENLKGIHTVTYDRDSAFGPPWVYNETVFTASYPSSSFHYSYEPFTPAYQNGFGTIRLTFFPYKGPGNYTLDEVQSNVTASFIRMPSDRTGRHGVRAVTDLLNWQVINSMDENVLKTIQSSSHYNATSGQGTDIENRYDTYKYASTLFSASSNWQQLDSSLNYLSKFKNKKTSYTIGEDNNYEIQSVENSLQGDGESWVVQPKWITPIYNFKSKTPAVPLYGTGSATKGIWHQYGSLCTGSDGVWVTISDLPKYKFSSSYGGQYSELQVLNDKRENEIYLEKNNAEIDFVINNANYFSPLTCSFYKGDGTLLASIFHRFAGDTQLGEQFVAERDNFTTAGNLASRINNPVVNDTHRYFTASVFLPLDNDIPDYLTGSLEGGQPTLIKIKIVDILNKSKDFIYSNGYSGFSGDEGNSIYGFVTSSYLNWTDSANKIACFRGKDKNGNYIFSNKVNFYGGKTIKYETKSLADLLGFEKTSKKLGETWEEKEISEAIIAVPFIEKNGQKKFINIDRRLIDVANGTKKQTEKFNPGESIREMVQSMKNYVIPPRFDFITNREIKPFAMYIFEFTKKLDKEDLRRIWQNLAPKSTYKQEFQDTIISHDLNDNELLGKIDDNLRWMVFKVKRKAKINYFEMTEDSRDDDRFKFKFKLGDGNSFKEDSPKYSYNWPYDYFSLVEMAQIQSEVELKKKS